MPGYKTSIYTIVPNQTHKIKLTMFYDFLRIHKTRGTLNYRIPEMNKALILLKRPPYEVTIFGEYEKK